MAPDIRARLRRLDFFLDPWPSLGAEWRKRLREEVRAAVATLPLC